MAKKTTRMKVETITHPEASRRNIPTAEYQAVMRDEELREIRVAYERRNRDLDPQLVWRGKDDRDWSDLVVHAPPLYIQEKVHPKVLIDDLVRRTEAQAEDDAPEQLGLFGDFNGLPSEKARTEFYQHDANWSNRMILGDSLQVMASLAEREGLRGKVQCIYIDPPYGIKFNSNFQWSTTSREVKDGNIAHITREPEQVKAFRDTWRDGIHSYLTYLRDRLTVARDLLAESGSLFVQIGDENLHLIKGLLIEIFGEQNYVNTIAVKKKGSTLISESVFDFLVWFSKSRNDLKIRRILEFRKSPEEDNKFNTLISPVGEMERIRFLSAKEQSDLLNSGWKWARVNYPIVSQDYQEVRSKDFVYQGRSKSCGKSRHWSFDNPEGLERLSQSNRIYDAGGSSVAGVVFHEDRPVVAVNNLWDDVKGEENAVYVVQTAWKIAQRCILMTTDPGDLVLDPTCGSGTTAYVAEQWGRRWITIDTSRVALALARARIMGARYPYFLLADSPEGKEKEAEIARTKPSKKPTYGNIRHGFVYERVPHITLKSIANNAEIDVIWDQRHPAVSSALEDLNAALKGHQTPFKVETGGRAGKTIDFTAPKTQTVKLPSGENAPAGEMLEWEVPREAPEDWPKSAKKPLEAFWKARVALQTEIDASISAKADFEYLYDRPYEDRKKVRVAGPFTVESLSPHRVLGVDENDELLDPNQCAADGVTQTPEPETPGDCQEFVEAILENLKTSGVQQAHKSDKIEFSAIVPWPGRYVCAEGRYTEGEAEAETEKRAAIFVGPEFGTVSRPDLAGAAREAAEAKFDVLITCAFNYDAHSSEFDKLGYLPVLKARMNADLHMADELKNTGKGNLFVIFGEPDIDLIDAGDGHIQVKINGVDVFDPSTGDVRSDDADGIACWFIDTDYNEESFFVRHAYFLGANDPYKALKTTLKAEINREAWDTLHGDTSRPFPKPASGRIAVKVINHLGDEVMKVFRVG
jgi:adenine-specific DNA-methyltransferase